MPRDALPFGVLKPRHAAVNNDTDDEDEEPEEDEDTVEDEAVLPEAQAAAGKRLNAVLCPRLTNEQSLGQLPNLEAAVGALKLTKRQRAQLRRFGPAKRLVKKMSQLIKLRGITECAYADIMPFYTKPDRNGKVYEDGTVLDHWLADAWARVNEALRPRDLPLPLLEEYCAYVSVLTLVSTLTNFFPLRFRTIFRVCGTNSRRFSRSLSRRSMASGVVTVSRTSRKSRTYSPMRSPHQ